MRNFSIKRESFVNLPAQINHQFPGPAKEERPRRRILALSPINPLGQRLPFDAAVRMQLKKPRPMSSIKPENGPATTSSSALTPLTFNFYVSIHSPRMRKEPGPPPLPGPRPRPRKVITAHCHYLCLCPHYIIFKCPRASHFTPCSYKKQVSAV